MLRRLLSSLFGRLPPAGADAVAGPLPWRKVFLVGAAILVCFYAVSVLYFARSVPDIGLHTAFKCIVNRVDRDHVRPTGPLVPEQEDVITHVNGRETPTWPDLLRELARIAQTEDEEVLVRLKRPRTNNEVFTAWCRIDRAALESMLPAVLWFFLKFGLFLVGVLVFWKRPNDRSAAQFFVLSVVTVGAYMGGYQWWRISTHPPLLVVFMVCAVLLPAVTLHFYLIFPRPKQFLQQWPRATLLAIYGVPVAFLAMLLGNYGRRALVVSVRPQGRRHRSGAEPSAWLHLRLFRRSGPVVPGLHRVPGPQFHDGARSHGAEPGQVDPVRLAGGAGANRLLAVPGPVGAERVRLRRRDVADVRGLGLFHDRVHDQHHAVSADGTGQADRLRRGLFPHQLRGRHRLLRCRLPRHVPREQPRHRRGVAATGAAGQHHGPGAGAGARRGARPLQEGAGSPLPAREILPGSNLAADGPDAGAAGRSAGPGAACPASVGGIARRVPRGGLSARGQSAAVPPGRFARRGSASDGAGAGLSAGGHAANAVGADAALDRLGPTPPRASCASSAAKWRTP